MALRRLWYVLIATCDYGCPCGNDGRLPEEKER